MGIIEDDAIMRRSLVRIFNGATGFTCLLHAATVEAFFEAWQEDIFLDIVLSDIGLPGISGIEGALMIRKRAPQCQVMMLTVYDDTENIFKALCAGASGYVSKQTSLSVVKEALQTIYDGGAYMSAGVARKITDHFSPIKPQHIQQPLTPREAQVLHAIEQGLSNKEIARRMDITPETVKSHIKKIYLKLEVNNRMDIVRGKYK